MALVDELIGGFDRALRALADVRQPARPSPAHDISENELPDEARARSAALMRVNHVGEICAQALYEGQALAARQPAVRESLAQAAREERDHLAWCAQRIEELGGRPSLLNPVWYAGSLALGVAASALGDRWNLAFLAETERQVEAHLSGHLARLPSEDRRTRAVVEQMRSDEARHRHTAIEMGAAELPAPVRAAMQCAARVMTTVSYRI
jgi:3-demethoxyubiquinol 3-hydroxylase